MPVRARLRTRAPKNIIGPQVRRLRNERGWSQPALAVVCQKLGWDIARDTIAKIEGQSRWVSDAELLMFARCFRIPLESLLPMSAASEKRARSILEEETSTA